MTPKRTISFRFLPLLAVLSMVAVPSWADSPSPKKVAGSYTYHGDRYDSPDMAKRKALEGARIDALSREFGTVISQDVLQSDRVGSHGETSKFLALSASEVQGEWLSDESQPEFKVELDAADNLVVSCSIQGLARAISNSAASFETAALRGGMPATEYYTGDNLTLSFTPSTDGYAAVFLMDESGSVFKMLPYMGDPRQEVKVKRNYDYVFFDEKRHPADFGEIDSFEITTDGEIEFNKLYVIFSPDAFSLPVMHAPKNDAQLPFLTEEEFTKWLLKTRRNDQRMGLKQINLKLFPAK